MFKYKQVIVARSDLDISPGKLSVQVAHASVSAAEKARTNKPKWFETWKKEKQKKVVVEVPSEKDLNRLSKEAKKLNLPTKLVEDAGLTELDPGTPTALGIGPAPNEKIDEVTGDLSLYGG